MNIGVLSDLHVDLNNGQCSPSVEDALCSAIRKRKLELMIIAGDVSNHYTSTLDTLTRLERDSGIPCLFVPGNHDLWQKEGEDTDSGTDSSDSMTDPDPYKELLAYSHNLGNGPYLIGSDWAVVGDAGWYDYSFGDSSFSEEQFRERTKGERVWKDKLYVRWGRSDCEVSDFFYDRLKAQLESLKNRQVIVVTHTLAHREFTVPLPNEEWRYFNAFLGSSKYGELIKAYADSVRYAVSGHVHYRKRMMIGRTECMNTCLGYVREWRCGADAAAEVEAALQTITL
ncbi:metallophosphoesterase [Paenibacillus sp. J5C_2022]|uniref:metallophosphoesterase n=1 Tax=Paenibacillus sp. J5C2022 TaxID=2977129 RepID=UPI0021CECC4A|nr:metallophosphoesterase [Paenibacillus sp. J5C2022]MCU6710120.1 metallophosphoesterase [Paenibacillus sp. J5C2022]